jgi:hypothetical protein
MKRYKRNWRKIRMKYAIAVLCLLVATIGVILLIAAPRVQRAELDAAMLNIPPSPIIMGKPSAIREFNELSEDKGDLFVYKGDVQIAVITADGTVLIRDNHTSQEVIRSLVLSLEIANHTSKPCNHAEEDSEPQNANF